MTRIGSAWNLLTPSGKVQAKKVILTNNGHLESLGFARNRLMHVFLYASMTAELDVTALKALGGQSRWGITPSNPMGTTMRRIDAAQGANRVITRTLASFRPGMQVTEAAVQRAARTHHDKFEVRYPALKGIKMEYSWAGHLCLTQNGVAMMRQLDDGLYAGRVQNGLGTARGTLSGTGAAELASGVESDITRRFMAEDLPKMLPPPPARPSARMRS